MHVLILGRVGSGKTSIAKQLVQVYHAQQVESLVLDPIGDPTWQARFVTSDPWAYLRVVRMCQSCALFVDESGEAIGQHHEEMFWLATRARHLGHTSHFIAQRAAQISPTVRSQCEMLIAFNLAPEDCKAMAREWACEALLEAWQLPRLQYVVVRGFGETTRGEVIFPGSPSPVTDSHLILEDRMRENPKLNQ